MMVKSMLLNVVEVNEVEDSDEEEEDGVQDMMRSKNIVI